MYLGLVQQLEIVLRGELDARLQSDQDQPADLQRKQHRTYVVVEEMRNEREVEAAVSRDNVLWRHKAAAIEQLGILQDSGRARKKVALGLKGVQVDGNLAAGALVEQNSVDDRVLQKRRREEKRRRKSGRQPVRRKGTARRQGAQQP